MLMLQRKHSDSLLLLTLLVSVLKIDTVTSAWHWSICLFAYGNCLNKLSDPAAPILVRKVNSPQPGKEVALPRPC